MRCRIFSLLFLGVRLITRVAAAISPVYVIEIQDHYYDINEAVEAISAFTLENDAQTKVRYIFDWELFSGFSFELSGVAATSLPGQLRSHVGVKNFWTLPTKENHPKDASSYIASPARRTRSPKPIDDSEFQQSLPRDNAKIVTSDGYSPHVMTGVDKLHAAGVKGHGTTIAIIDYCYDYKQNVFGGSIGPGQKITYAYNWVDDSTDVYCTCDIHGTGMLGVVAANPTRFGLVGVAPEASIEIHSFANCETPGVEDDLLIYTVSNVAKRNVDVISFSINSSPTSWPSDFRSVVISRIQQNGTFIAVSAGNGRGKPFSIQPPASGIGVPAVGMVNNVITPYVFWNGSYSLDGVPSGTVEWNPGQVGSEGPQFAPKLKVWVPLFSEAGPEAFRTCTDLPYDVTSTLPNVNDTILLLSDDDCFNINGTYITDALPWKYLLYYSPRSYGNISVLNNNFQEFTYAGTYLGLGSIDWEQANSWVQYMKSGKDLHVTLATQDAYELSYHPVKDNITGGRMNDASLWGPTFDSRIGPTFVAPGGQILDIVPEDLGGFLILTGTSFAAPFAAGCAALLKQIHPDWDADMIRNALTLTARPIPNNDLSSKDFGFLAPTQQQGGGLVDAYAAAYGTTLVNTSSLSFNTTRNLQKSVAFRVTNTAATSVSYTLHHIPAASFYAFTSSNRSVLTIPNTVLYQPEEIFKSSAELAINPPSITIPPFGSTEVSVYLLSLPQSLDESRVPIYGGYITLNNSDSSAPAEARFELSIPYTGIAAELYGISVLDDIVVEAVSDGSSHVPVEPTGHVFNVTYTNGTVTAPQLPGFSLTWVLASQRLIIDLIEYPSNEVIIPADYDDFPHTSDVWYWDGTDGNNKFIPQGKYYWRASALQIEGEYNNPADYVVKTTGWFQISYTSDSTGFPSAERRG